MLKGCLMFLLGYLIYVLVVAGVFGFLFLYMCLISLFTGDPVGPEEVGHLFNGFVAMSVMGFVVMWGGLGGLLSYDCDKKNGDVD